MNCKPGDLARVIDHPDSRSIGVVDRIVLVTTLKMHCGLPAWRLGASPMRCPCGCGGVIESIADMLLRPLRDPGDDAIDWVSHRTPRSVDLHDDQLTQARAQLLEAAS